MRRWLILVCVLAGSSGLTAAEPVSFKAGFARVDITPEVPLRLSGYASRTEPFTAVQTPIYARAMAFEAEDDETYLLFTIDTIGPPASLTNPVAKRIEKEFGVTRDRIVFCGSHSHSTPHLSGGLSNLFAKPLPPEEEAATKKYTERLADALVEAAGQAIDDLAPAKLSVGQGKVGFAMNRRGNRPPPESPPPVPPRGAVDHSVPVLKVTDPEGKLRGVVFNYACHATTLTGTANVVNGDWPGYACRYLEESHEGITALCTIGCGGDANPAPRAGEHPERHAQAHGRELALEVARLLKQELTPVTAAPQASYGYAGLPIDRPTIADLKADLESSSPQVVRRAEYYLDLLTRMDRIPESYPMPLQTWQFGDELTMIFLGGEVVVDYALRLKEELESGLVWVSAYSNDVFGYVASERVRSEGGYEVDSSMIYYNQPGRWSTGTEEVVIKRVHELLANPGGEHALSPEEAKQSMVLPEGWEVDLVASEPLVEDPVNIAFGPDGRLWVVEMRDYPRGEDGQGAPGGRIKVLTDTDQDGTFDEAKIFLDGLAYPNGVIPWRDGALVSCAPDIFFAKDTDGDGAADEREVLFTGFPEANPQHRVNGFAWGLDGLMYVAHGAAGISCPKTGKEYNFAGRDFAFNPDTCEVFTMTGGSQFGRVRDDWGSWFANTNSNPLFHFVAEDHQLSRNPYLSPPSAKRNIVPAELYHVWPESRIIDRFNDLNSAGRVTAMCGPIIFRGVGFGEEPVAFACAPVHNLVRGFRLIPDGLTFKAELLPVESSDETPQEFFASTDPWFRPVRAKTGPDDALWIVDMYRLVIEHPEWIPEAWQARLDLRAGSNRGRIWRVRKADLAPTALPDLTKLSMSELVARLDDPNGVVRDLAQQVLVWRGDENVVPEIRKLVLTAEQPTGVVQALATLGTLDALDAKTLLTAFEHDDPRVVRFAIRLAAPLLNEHPELGAKIVELSQRADERIRLQAAFSLGEWDDPRAAAALAALAAGPDRTGWIRVAVQSSALGHADEILAELLRLKQTAIAGAMVTTILGENAAEGTARVLEILEAHPGNAALWRIEAITAIARKTPQEQRQSIAAHPVVQETLAAAREHLADEKAEIAMRIAAAKLLASPLASTEDQEQLVSSLTPRMPVEIQEEIVAALGATGSPAMASRLLAGWIGYPPHVRGVILQAMLSRPVWTNALLDGLASETILPGDIGAAPREQLLASEDEAIRSRAKKLLDVEGNPSREALVAQFQPVIAMSSDAARGRDVFKESCASCHQLEEMGKEFGPDLTGLTDRTASTLLIAVLDPNRAVEAKYRGYSIVTTDGQVLSGLITSESTNAITLATADGRTTQILRSDIEILRDSGKSFMPEGLERDLSRQDLADVLAFVREAGG